MPSSFRRSFNRAGGKMAQQVTGLGMKELLAQMLETPEVKEERQLGLRVKKAQVKELEEPTEDQISVPLNLQKEFNLPPTIDKSAAPLAAAYISFKKPHLGGASPESRIPYSKETSDAIRLKMGLPAGELLTPATLAAHIEADPEARFLKLISVENQGLFLSPESKKQVGIMKEKYIERGTPQKVEKKPLLGGRIRIKIKSTGEIGFIDEKDFNSDMMEKNP